MNKTIKMLVAGMSAAALAIVLIACGGQKQGTEVDVVPETSVETEADPSATVGGWTLPSAISSTLTAEEQAIFDKAIEGITGVGYDPVAVTAVGFSLATVPRPMRCVSVQASSRNTATESPAMKLPSVTSTV